MTTSDAKSAIEQTQQPLVRTRHDAGVAYIVLRNPPQNALTLDVRRSLVSSLQIAQDDPEVKVICLRGQRMYFSNGLDADELAGVKAGSLEAEPTLEDLCRTIEDSSKPVVAALRGTVFDGGLALAVAAHYRLCGPKTRFGTPEVALGMVPGGGLTQRLPRLVGPDVALKLLLSGQAMGGRDAKKHGLCNALVDMRNFDALEEFCEGLIKIDAVPKPTREGAVGLNDGAAYIATIAEHRDRARKSNMNIASSLIIDCVEAALLLPFEAGVFREAAARVDMLGSTQVRAMRHVSLAENRVTRPAGLDVNQARKVSKIGISGMSTLALDLAMSALDRGFEVLIFGSDANQVALAQGKIARFYEQAAQQGHMTPEVRDQRLAQFSGACDLQSLADCDLVIDSTTESIERCAQVLSRIEEFVSQDTVLATTMDRGISQIAQDLSHPERFLGLHFFEPVKSVKVVELARNVGLSNVALASTHAVLRKMGKVPVCVAAHDGLIANTLKAALWSAVDVMLLMGVEPSQIDHAMELYGMPTGPCATMDELGLEHFSGVAATLLNEAGRKGRGGSGGFYDYNLTDKGPERRDDKAAIAMINVVRENSEINRAALSDTQICDRIVLAQANAGARLLQEGVVERAVDIDAVMVLSKAFPRWRGGPMFAADVMRPLVVQKKLREFSDEAPDIWEPAQIWAALIKNGDDLETFNLS